MKTKLIFILLLFSIVAFGQSNRVKELERERAKLSGDIEATSKLLEENKTITQNINTRVNLLKDQIKARTSILNVMDKEIKEIDREVFARERQIRSLEKDLQAKKEKYAETVQAMYLKKNQSNKLLFILSADDFSQALRRIVYLREYSSFHIRQAEEIKEQQHLLEEQKTLLNADKDNKVQLLNKQKEEQNQLVTERNSLDGEMKTLQSRQKEIQKDLADKQKKRESLNKEIERIIAEEIAKAEEAERKAREKKEAAGKKPDATKPKGDGFSETKEDTALSKTFGTNKGKIPFPIKGKYKIVNRFGKLPGNTFPLMDYSGIELLTIEGTDALAVFDGEVIAVGVIQGYCTYILVKHGKYYTLYRPFETVYVKNGDKVNKGQALGKIFTDKTKGGDGTLLHFEIRDGKTALNPELWLNK